MTETPKTPKLFISYSWSSPEHSQWVLQFAEELVSQGIEVLLDKWDLKPGHDTFAFMESMVVDPTVTKVLMICDAAYARKSDQRQGGAGTEAQIITPGIYAKAAQSKFAAVVRERDSDGGALVPTYYRGRLYFDLEDSTKYPEEFEKIVRWAWDAPADVRPPLGAKPSFLTKESSTGKIATSVHHRRAMDGLRAGHDRASGHVSEYLRVITDGMPSFRIVSGGSQEFDDTVIQSIEDFTPYRNELIELFIAIAQFNPSSDILESVHRFFERCIVFYEIPEGTGSYSEWDCDNFKFIVHELFLYLIASLLASERHDAAAYFVNTEYYLSSWRRSDSGMITYDTLDAHIASLDHRNKRLKMTRVSVRADMIKERNLGSGVRFEHLQTADTVLYLRSVQRSGWPRWFPETLLFAGYSTKLELFARAKSRQYFNRLQGLLGVSQPEEFKDFIATLIADPKKLPSWDYRRGASIGTLTAVSDIATGS